MLLPAAQQHRLPACHLAPVIDDTMAALELNASCAHHEDGGSRVRPFHPAMPAEVLVYAHATGLIGSRRIGRRPHEDLAFRMLAAASFPRHRGICDFRALYLKGPAEPFVQVLRQARGMGLATLEPRSRRRLGGDARPAAGP